MNENILFIDDDENLLSSYVRQFKRDYNVQTASSGTEAVRILKEGKIFPVIISDYSMPNMNGVQFFETANKISPQTIKILVTGNADINTALDAINKGHIFRFITKPFNIEILRKAIADALYQHKLISIEKIDLLKNEFLNTISHEIRTPLNGISSFLQLIKSELEDKTCDRLRPYFDIIDENSNRLLRTIHLITDISQVISKTVDIKFEPIDLIEDVIRPFLSKFREMAESKETVLDLNMEINECKIIYDKYCLEQIFSNILHNALTFTTKGLVTITLTKNGDNVILEISDNGIGMNDEFQKRMFEPFVQEEMGASKSYEGNGLGLTLVKEYCDLLEINLEVESKKNIGTTFRLTLKSEV